MYNARFYLFRIPIGNVGCSFINHLYQRYLHMRIKIRDILWNSLCTHCIHEPGWEFAQVYLALPKKTLLFEVQNLMKKDHKKCLPQRHWSNGITSSLFVYSSRFWTLGEVRKNHSWLEKVLARIRSVSSEKCFKILRQMRLVVLI